MVQVVSGGSGDLLLGTVFVLRKPSSRSTNNRKPRDTDPNRRSNTLASPGVNRTLRITDFFDDSLTGGRPIAPDCTA